MTTVHHAAPVPPPPSYAVSFNPFPALVIGVTGAAMSTHYQTYLFSVCPPLSARRASDGLSVYAPDANTCPLGPHPGLLRAPLLHVLLHVAPAPALVAAVAPGGRGRGWSVERRGLELRTRVRSR